MVKVIHQGVEMTIFTNSRPIEKIHNTQSIHQSHLDKARIQKSTVPLSRTVTKNVANLLTGDLILIDPSVAPSIGDVALCGILDQEERLEVYKDQRNVIGKVTFKWCGE